MADTVVGWWFSSGKQLPRGDRRRIAVGRTHKVKGEIIPCENGLHLSVKPLDALSYAPGPIVWRVRGSGVCVPHGSPVDKYACSERTYLAGGVVVSDVLWKFARLCALDVIHLWDAPEIVVRYLKTGWDRDAASDAASAAARAAARDAAWDAARAAASAAASDAARAAASAAARAAASDAARDATIEKQNRRLHHMLMDAIRQSRG